MTASRDERQRRAATTIFDMAFWISIGAFALHNALITHALHSRAQIGVDAVALFVVAMTMHFTINDYGMRRRFFDAYQQAGRWLLAGAIVIGWLAGFLTDTGDAPFLLILAFISGGTVIHVLSEEIPEERGGNFASFLLGVAVYGAILLAV
ncbi:hypothetical protein BH23CHL2_BH23CHL2_14340 [soil metagenome]